MNIPLIFKKNKLLQYKEFNTLCPCYDDENKNLEKYLHPECIQIIDKSFKGIYCPYKAYNGPTSIFSSISTEQYNDLLKQYTSCHHLSEGIDKTEWRCFKCNAVVSSERERHKNCYFK